jgi:hypothetical protein
MTAADNDSSSAHETMPVVRSNENSSIQRAITVDGDKDAGTKHVIMSIFTYLYTTKKRVV